MFHVHSWKDESTGETKLVFYQEGEGRSRVVFNLHTHEFRQLLMGERVPPEYVLTIPWNMGGEIERALAEWLDGKGVRTDHDAKLEGTLMATRYHLQDLRELLKLSPPKVYSVDAEGNLRAEKPPLGERKDRE